MGINKKQNTVLSNLLFTVNFMLIFCPRAHIGGKCHIPCPPNTGGLLTEDDPDSPGPFHDLTKKEYQHMYSFLKKKRPDLNLVSPSETAVNTSSIFIADLLLPAKQDVLSFLDEGGTQPEREAQVMIFRGGKKEPVVEEYRVGPLSNIKYAELIVNSQRKNPVPYAVRPTGAMEYKALDDIVLSKVDQEIGHILRESYNSCFSDCGDNWLDYYDSSVGTGVLGETRRKKWVMAHFPLEYYSVYPLDFGLLVAMDSADPEQWTVEKVWYSGAVYDSLSDLKEKYDSGDPSIKKTRIDYPTEPDDWSELKIDGTPFPDPPKRPPVQVEQLRWQTEDVDPTNKKVEQLRWQTEDVDPTNKKFEPDGKRYSISHRHVTYLQWSFDVRLSALMGPQIYDVRFQGERIAYEVGLSEIAVFYSGDDPTKLTDYVDSGELLGIHSRSLIDGADCPEGATFLSATFFGQFMEKATTLERAMCVFEQNSGVPLRRHLSYTVGEGGFYGGMADSMLIVRSILTIDNYDYIVDFMFHQNGALETRAISTGYVLPVFGRPEETPYGWRLNDRINAIIHHHMFHFKADLDINGVSNRYETLDIGVEAKRLQEDQQLVYTQTKFKRNLRRTEEDAVYHFNFDKPKYHIVHNEKKKTEHDVPKGFRIAIAGMSKQILPEDLNNEPTISWARQQLAVTVHKDDELVSSSPYAMFDSYDPVTKFANFISNESIVDQDLVLWITMGVHHIPHAEDLPVTPTVGGHLSFFFLPYNYFPKCPSMASRDHIRVQYHDPENPADGLVVDRSGNQVNDFCGRKTLEQVALESPDDLLQTTQEDFHLR